MLLKPNIQEVLGFSTVMAGVRERELKRGSPPYHDT
jgi:hypothetical protein